tara:strand:- start:119 stop:589 length:471 start_codon:yes stop_codon:yes gene_type:complete
VVVVDSNEKKLSLPNVVVTFIENVGSEMAGVSNANAIRAALMEMNQKNSKVVQFGNTVFSNFVGDDGKMMGRIFNVDTAENYFVNILKFGKYLQRKKVTHYLANFNKEYKDLFIPMMRKLKQFIAPLGGNVGVAEMKDGSYTAFVLVPKETIVIGR